MNVISSTIEEVLHFSKQLRQEQGLRARLIRRYWRGSYFLTRLLESKIDQSRRLNPAKRILNFGCGVRLLDDAVNSDLFAGHRLLLGRQKPDLYWSGASPLPYLDGRFTGIICEHVIEHMLPDDTLTLFKNLRGTLAEGGVFVVSFPNVAKVLAGGLCQGYQSIVTSVNSVIYRHGHVFMYDERIVVELLRAAGFSQIRMSTYQDLPLKACIGTGRAPESSYVIAE